MVNETYAAHLREKASHLPLSPGVYLMKNASGTVIYVGKSRALRNRVSQYFHENPSFNEKTHAMTHAVCDFDVILCQTEMEALTLENSLIKLYQPHYNILLKDDKSYPYLVATLGEPFPRLTVSRKREPGKNKYYGPYSGTDTVRAVIAALERAFGLPSCRYSFPHDTGKVKHCLYRQMGCLAPCDGKITEAEYRTAFDAVIRFLDGDVAGVEAHLTEKMNYAADNLMFEAAAEYRDRLRAIGKLAEKQRVVDAPNVERDIVGWYVGEDIVSVCLFFVRSGRLLDKKTFFFSGGEIFDDDSVISFLAHFYQTCGFVPREIVLADPIAEEERALCEQFLREQAKAPVHLRISYRGELHKFCENVRKNAEMAAIEYRKSSEQTAKSLIRLASLCGLEVVPERIEAFDISNYGNEGITAGMVVFEGTRPKKSEYRVYKMKTTEGQDDYASMREALSRRLAHLSDEGAKAPDLILLDGGKGHVETVTALMRELGVSIPVLGMVKDAHHKTRALVSETGEISIAGEQAVFALIYQIQEEVHRFTVSRMTGAKRNKERTSV
ncbi:MAG: excinuclease ABC subunit UvrC, partial [Ruminococcus sp.]|nr:excinuclease ABC subunit UvrC [Candidatus Apopatosoma intestinale]